LKCSKVSFKSFFFRALAGFNVFVGVLTDQEKEELSGKIYKSALENIVRKMTAAQLLLN
jgi:hypothetical protein